MPDFSRLRPFIADSEEDGPDSTLVIRGFSGREEIQAFMDAIMQMGVTRPPQDQKN